MKLLALLGQATKSPARRKISINWLHIYTKDKLLTKSNDAAKQAKDLNSSFGNKGTHVFPESFLSFTLLFHVFRDWIKFGFWPEIIHQKVASFSSWLNLNHSLLRIGKNRFLRRSVTNLWL